MIKKGKIPFLLISLFLIMIACRKSNGFKEAIFYDFNETGMIPRKEYVYYPFENIKNDSLSSEKYDLTLVVRYSEFSVLKYLPLTIEYSSLNRDSIIETKLKIPLYLDDNNLVGHGGLGIFQTEMKILNNLKYENEFFISVSTLEEDSHGILSLGVVLQPI